MAALLAVVTFLFFVTLDYLLHRREYAAQATTTAEPEPPAFAAEILPREEPVWVAGYELPERLHYHQGHTWARAVGPDTVAVGMDDFARRLTGDAEAIEVPARGAWIHQGAETFRLQTDGRGADLVSPVDGEVVEVNPALAEDPSLATRDPYGKGWICKVRCASLKSDLRNLLSGRMARRWMEDAREQLELKLMAFSGSVLQDGGEPAPDFAKRLKTEDWNHLVESFLLTRTKET